MPSRTILLVDADPLQRQLVDMLLAQDAPTIVNTGTGREALEYLKEHTPHLVILAWQLPDIGGDVVCSKLKGVSRLSPVPVILTVEPPGRAGLPREVRERARSVGADLLLQKPLGDKNLRERVQSLLARWEQPERGTGRSTTSTAIIEDALQELVASDEAPIPADPVTDAVYRENEELRQEVASLKRRLARLESGLSERAGRNGRAERDGGAIVAGHEPAAPAEPQAPDGARGGEPVAGGRADADGRGDPGGHAEATGLNEPPAVQPTEADADPLQALQQRVRELERRNRALLEALEASEEKSSEEGRGIFRRRRS